MSTNQLKCPFFHVFCLLRPWNVGFLGAVVGP